MSTTSPPIATDIAERLAAVHERIADAERRAGRAPGSVTLVGVSKTVGRPDIDAAYAAGLRDFGENRVQDMRDKFSHAVPPDLRMHLIGTLQTNKVRYVVGLAHLIHCLDRIALAEELHKRAERLGVVQQVLIQVNIAREEQKHGCEPEELPELIEQVLARPGLALRGLMTMAPLVAAVEEARPVFVGLRDLGDAMRTRYPEADLGELSMGMTNDYVAAIEEGATIVRVGRAIFAESAGA